MSFLNVTADQGFGLENLPYGVFSTASNPQPRPGVAIGDHVLDLSAISHLFRGELLSGGVADRVFHSEHLNDFMSLGPASWQEARSRIQQLLAREESELRDDMELRKRALVARSDVKMHMPARVGDYTDFYSSLDHATNVGILFRGKENPLLPNWKHIPVAYHARSSSVVVSGTDIRRPNGQTKPSEADPPVFDASKRLDFELEVAFFVGSAASQLGEVIPIDEAESHIFGLVLLNDWSARDIQKWEYVPLGPFGSKNFATSISPWIVPLAALKPFQIPKWPQTEPQPLPYLRAADDYGLDIELTVDIVPGGKQAARTRVTTSNCRHLYWSMKQQLAHHSITGCNMRPGDLLASGTVSGPTPESRGCLLELTWNGSKAIQMKDGSSRTFLEDGDEVIISGVGVGQDGVRVAFGDCSGVVVPAHVVCADR